MDERTNALQVSEVDFFSVSVPRINVVCHRRVRIVESVVYHLLACENSSVNIPRMGRLSVELWLSQHVCLPEPQQSLEIESAAF